MRSLAQQKDALIYLAGGDIRQPKSGGDLMSKEEISRQAYSRWEAEGRPDGQHERHWREAEEATQSNALPQTWSSDHAGGISPKTKVSKSKPAKPARSGAKAKPGDQASVI